MPDRSLYDAILSRKSMRRFAPELNTEMLQSVQEACMHVQALVPENRFYTAVEALDPARNLVTLLGAYGRLAAPPYIVIPSIEGDNHLLTDLGFRSEQLVIKLTQLGVGTCYIGTLAKEDQTRQLFNLNANQRIGAVIAIGLPTSSGVDKAINMLIRSVAGATNKLPSERLYYSNLAEEPTAPPPNWAPLIEAARTAPSAVNVQPWRFVGKDNHLYILTLRHSRRYGNGPGAAYKYYDCGLCMANIYMAMQALDINGTLRLCSATEEGLPNYPQEFQLLAELVVG